jgi:hypothetical protein
MSFTREAYRRLRHPGVRIRCFLGCVVCFFVLYVTFSLVSSLFA